jgi:glycosyltransferase involved in cell wall biosynthesis
MPMQAHLTALLLARNEAERYLRRVTDQLSRIVDAFVVVDDVSTDDTPYVVASYPKVRILQRNTIPGFDDEYALRRLVWDLAVGTGPDWLLTLDADEVFEDRAEADIPRLLRRSDICPGPSTAGVSRPTCWSDVGLEAL